MNNIVATVLTTLYKFALGYLLILLAWMEMHRYAYLLLGIALGFASVQ